MNPKTDVSKGGIREFSEGDTSVWGTREGLSEEVAPEPRPEGWECASVQRTLPGSLQVVIRQVLCRPSARENRWYFQSTYKSPEWLELGVRKLCGLKRDRKVGKS